MPHLRTGLLFESATGLSRFLVEAGAPPFLVGRRPPFAQRNIKLDVHTMSRQHFRVRGDDGFQIEDAESTGGTSVDDVRIGGWQPIGPGARINSNPYSRYHTRASAGASLHDLVTGTSGPVCTAREAAAMARDLLRALAPLHAEGRVHGDLDARHALREDTGRWITLIDGWTALDPDGMASGDPIYCAPEVFSRNVCMPASDLYAVGLLCFEARFGYRPFDPPDVQAHMMTKLSGAAPDWRPGERVDPCERDLYLRLLSLRPEDRGDVADILDLVHDLQPDLRPS